VIAYLLRHALFPVLAVLVLTQCASGPGRSARGGRSGQLKRLGFESVSLQKIRGDVRYSGVFKVNTLPFRFLIDSGANSTDLDATLARQARLVEDRSVKIVTRGALGREVSSGRGYGTLQIGPMFAENFPFTIAPSTGKKTSTSSYAGQVGMDALSAIGAMVDIPGQQLWVPGGRRGMVKAPLAAGEQNGLGQNVLNLEMAGRLPHLILRGALDGRPVTWVVDTGAEVSVMAAESFDRFNLPSQTTDSRMIDASGDRIALRRAQLRNVSFGNVTVTVFDIAIAPLGTVREYFRDSRGRPVDGILGMDFLTTRNALLDTGSRLIYLGNP
jgi:predicted aspartyl protease